MEKGCSAFGIEDYMLLGDQDTLIEQSDVS